MIKTHLSIAAMLAIVSLSACSGESGTTSTTDSTSRTSMSPGDSSVTTTTTVTHHRYSGTFTPKPETRYIDLKTQKQITVRIDTVRGEVVNSETNEPIDLFVEPITHDTIYGLTGSVVNNYIIHDKSGDYRVDTVRINTVTTVNAEPASTTPEHTGNYKEKDKDNKSKIKTDDVKIKEKNGVTKIKAR